MHAASASFIRFVMGTLLILTLICTPAFAEDLLIEGFETTWPPSGWVEITTHTSNWFRSTSAARSGQYGALCQWAVAVQDEYIVTPALDFSSAVNPKLEFYEDELEWYSGYRHYIMASTTSQTDPAAFSIVEEWSPSNHTINGYDGDPTTVYLTDLAGEPTVYLAFRYHGTPGSHDIWYVDDVRVFLPGEHDVACTEVYPDGGRIEGGTNVTPQATIENAGSSIESFNVQMEIVGATPVYSEVVAVSNLQPGEEVTVDFPTFNVPAGSYYDVIGTTLLATDGNEANDSYTGGFNSYTDGHIPLGLLFTNSGCGPCVPANQALDAFMNSDEPDEFSLLRIHVWWPYPGDIMYTHNSAQASELVDDYGVSGVPNFFVDGPNWDLGSSSSGIAPAMLEAATWYSPMDISLSWNNQTENLVVTMHIDNHMPAAGNFRLFTSITEDDIHHNGGNGEPIHDQAFRRMYPDTHTGTPISTVMGNHSIVVPIDLHPIWDYENLRATAFVMDMSSNEVLQSKANFLTSISGGTGAEPAAIAFALGENFPNPFNPKTSIKYTLGAAGHANLSIYDLEGRLVRTLFSGFQDAGEHQVSWNGTDDAGQSMASGVYFYRLVGDKQSEIRKMLLLK